MDIPRDEMFDILNKAIAIAQEASDSAKRVGNTTEAFYSNFKNLLAQMAKPYERISTPRNFSNTTKAFNSIAEQVFSDRRAELESAFSEFSDVDSPESIKQIYFSAIKEAMKLYSEVLILSLAEIGLLAPLRQHEEPEEPHPSKNEPMAREDNVSPFPISPSK